MGAAEQLDTITTEHFGITYAQYRKLTLSHNYTDLITVLTLLKTKQPRAPSRQRAKQQVLDWVEGKTNYFLPLSPKLYAVLTPSWSTHPIDVVIKQIKQIADGLHAPTRNDSAASSSDSHNNTEPSLVKESAVV